MALVPDSMPAAFATASEMCHYFMERHHGDVDAAALEMEALLDQDKELYDAMVDALMRMAVEEKALEYLAGLGEEAVRARGESSPCRLREVAIRGCSGRAAATAAASSRQPSRRS